MNKKSIIKIKSETKKKKKKDEDVEDAFEERGVEKRKD